MNKLRVIRDRAEEQYQIEMNLLNAMSVIESLRTWARLQDAYAWQLAQTALLFEHTHRENLIELQARLMKLAEKTS